MKRGAQILCGLCVVGVALVMKLVLKWGTWIGDTMEQRDHGDENDRPWLDKSYDYDDLHTPCAEEPKMNMWDYLDVAKEALDIVIKLALIAVLAHLTYLLGILVGTLR